MEMVFCEGPKSTLHPLRGEWARAVMPHRAGCVADVHGEHQQIQAVLESVAPPRASWRHEGCVSNLFSSPVLNFDPRFNPLLAKTRCFCGLHENGSILFVDAKPPTRPNAPKDRVGKPEGVTYYHIQPGWYAQFQRAGSCLRCCYWQWQVGAC